MYLQFFRVFDWVHVLGLTMLGFIFASGTNINPFRFIIALLISALYLAHGYSLNECFDVIIKHKPNRRNLFSESLIPFRVTMISSYVVLFLNGGISFLFSKHIFVLVLMGAVFAWLYSVPPLRLKEKPFLGILCNSLGFSVLFLIGFSSVKTIDAQAILMTVFIFLLFLPIQLIHEINDLEDDKTEGIDTIAVKFGVRTTFYLITLFLIILIGYAYILYHLLNIMIYFLLITTFFSLALTLYLFRRFDRHSGKLNTQRLKINVRYLCIIYGMGILLSFKNR